VLELKRGRPALIGMIHLAPLPGAPAPAPWRAILAAARRDARAWEAGGADAVLVENFGDRPFHPEAVPPVTIAALSRVLTELRSIVSLPIGVNVLRNDAAGAIALAAACELDFVRINVHAGVAVSDQGLLVGRSDATVRLRAALRCQAMLLCDLRVKHARALVERPLLDEAAELVERSDADALLLTGSATGRPPDLAMLAPLAAAFPATPLLLASGATPSLLEEARAHLSGCIVGTGAKRGGRLSGPVDPARVRALARACRGR
jgi:membrane complex biogenesis BtpA family protein